MQGGSPKLTGMSNDLNEASVDDAEHLYLHQYIESTSIQVELEAWVTEQIRLEEYSHQLNFNTKATIRDAIIKAL